MPDQLNKQSLVNLLIDSPLREPIKINLIDIVNNTTDPDLPKVFPTIVKELEIFQKATERRMKLAEETITKLGGSNPSSPSEAVPAAPSLPPVPPTTPEPPTEPTLPSMPTDEKPGLSVPPLGLPPLPSFSTPPNQVEVAQPAPLPVPTPLGGPANSPQADEDALAEIQKELDSLKTSATEDAAPVTPSSAPQA